MAEHWVEIAVVDYVIKILISVLLFIPLYGVLLNALMRFIKKHDVQQIYQG